jgi:ABC-type multidrug transport system ATPase subunit
VQSHAAEAPRRAEDGGGEDPPVGRAEGEWNEGVVCMVTDTAAVSRPKRAGETRPAEVVFRTRNLSKRYGSRLAVDNLSLEVRRGEIFGFLGPNGAGKTTTIRMALGLIAPSDGGVEILGLDVTQNRARILPRVGALVEQPALYTYMSGRDNLRAVASVLGGVPAERLDAVLELVALRERQKDRVRTYSLGMKQRLGVAIALLNDPEVLILDEPANGLDPAGIVEMRDLLRRLAAEGKTVFISSHVLTEVQQICTRVAIINLGRLVTESSVEELTRGHGEFEVRVERAARVLALLREQPWGAGARLDGDNTIVTRAPEGGSAALNLFLVKSGVVPEAISEHAQDLEEIFLRLTGSAMHGGVR